MASLGLTAAASPTDSAIQKKTFELERPADLITCQTMLNDTDNFKWRNGWYHENS